MAGRQTADIVFCMDASGSMCNAFSGVRNHVNKMLESIKSDLQMQWDVRFDFLAYSNTSNIMKLRTVNYAGRDVIDALYNGGAKKGLFGFRQVPAEDFFTSDVGKFERELGKIECEWDEATGLALDIAADFPFRDSATCHRVVVLLTDEPINDGKFVQITNDRIMDLARKYQERKIALFMVTPPCPVFDTLSQIDKCEWTIDESHGLENIDFAKLMQTIGKSVSISQTSQGGVGSARPLFNEKSWSKCRVDGNEDCCVEVGMSSFAQ